jgi:hypothetical protein
VLRPRPSQNGKEEFWRRMKSKKLSSAQFCYELLPLIKP